MNLDSHWQHSSATGNWLLGAVKRNPEGLLLLAAGCVLMMRTGGSARRASSSGDDRSSRSRYEPANRYADQPSPRSTSAGAARAVTGGVSRTAESAKESATEFKDNVSQAATSYASSVSDYAEEARRSITERSESIARGARSTLQDTMNRVLREQPLAVAVLGLAAGAAVAAMLPPSVLERQALGPAGEKISDAATKAGEQLKEGTAKAGERLMSAADKRGLNADGLKEVAREVAGAFGSAFSGDENARGQSSEPNSNRRPDAADMRGQVGQPHGTSPGAPVDQSRGSGSSNTRMTPSAFADPRQNASAEKRPPESPGRGSGVSPSKQVGEHDD